VTSDAKDSFLAMPTTAGYQDANRDGVET